MVHRDGALESKSLRIPLGVARFLTVTGITLAVLLLIAAALYAPIARTAARVPGLNREIERLREENEQVTVLAATLAELEARYDQVRSMFGVEIVPDRTSLQIDELPEAVASLAGPPGPGDTYDPSRDTPIYWPLQSFTFITRGHGESNPGSGAHPGVDIAAPPLTPIRASGTGIVIEASDDAEYGLYVRVGHADGYQTMYGHATRVLVSEGDSVMAGEVIGLSGSTGRSTAPHLHFEVIKNGVSLDPGTVVREES